MAQLCCTLKGVKMTSLLIRLPDDIKPPEHLNTGDNALIITPSDK
jgi:hypothetical protein